MFYCDLGSIGLMEKRGKAWKEIKYNLKKCIKKRANGEKPRNILVKPKGIDIKMTAQLGRPLCKRMVTRVRFCIVI